MLLAALQELAGQQGRLLAIAVSSAGGVRDGPDNTDAVVAKLRTAQGGANQVSSRLSGLWTGPLRCTGWRSVACLG